MSPIVLGAFCPNFLCSALNVPDLQGGEAARFDPQTKSWEFRCHYCHRSFRVGQDQLIQREVSAKWVSERTSRRNQ
jgi:hypothetical protein